MTRTDPVGNGTRQASKLINPAAMKGIVRPCRHRLGPELQARWLGHLCGLCLSLRDTAGQAARVLTGYDALLVSYSPSPKRDA